jgi:O-antigen/teichoic acid export membrane protein
MWVLATRVGNALLTILVSAILARMLDPENLGYYFLIFSVVDICSNLVRGGLDFAAIRLIAEAEARGQLGRARQTVVFTLLGVSAIALLFSALYYLFLGDWLFTHFFHSPKVLGLTGLIAAWIVIDGLVTQVAHIFRGMHAVRLAAMLNGFVLTLVTLVLLMYLYTRPVKPQLGEVVVCGITGATVALLMSLAFLRASLSKFKGDGSIRVAEIASISWPLFLIGLANMCVTHADMLLVGYLFDEIDVATYGVALRLKGIVLLHLLALGMVLSPLIAKLYAQQEKLKLEQVMRLVATIAIVPVILIMLVVLLVGDSLIGWIFGEVYRGANLILIIILGGMFVAATMGSGQQLMIMTGHERILLSIKIIGGLCAILGALLAAPGLGIVGIALAFSLSMAGVSVAITLTAKKLTGIACYIHPPGFFMNGQNRRALLQELRAVIGGESMPRRRGKGRATTDED